MPVTWYDGVVQKITEEAPNVRRFWVEIPEKLEFRAGQFVTMDLPIGDKRLQRWRSYSIANAPDPSGLLEFCIVRNPQGAATQYLFDSVQVGSTLRFKGPDGAFYLPETIDRDLVLICTGTGVAPFRSMLLDLQQSGKSHRNIHLIFGTRSESGILYRAELEALTQTMPGFRYDVALSQAPDWSGYRGYVHQIYLEQYRNTRPDVDFYICGWAQMIDEAVQNLLLELGYDRGQVHFELYG
jgi:CDP-4-dehydro-6-deoxyglucose reductase